jgi:hypothetical protein
MTKFIADIAQTGKSATDPETVAAMRPFVDAMI